MGVSVGIVGIFTDIFRGIFPGVSTAFGSRLPFFPHPLPLCVWVWVLGGSRLDSGASVGLRIPGQEERGGRSRRKARREESSDNTSNANVKWRLC